MTTTDTVKLAACPFCNKQLVNPDGYSPVVMVHPQPYEDCPAWGIVVHTDMPERVAAWNRRALPAGGEVEPVAWACKTCNSPRSIDPCPKCGTPLTKPADGWDWPALPDIDRIRALAREVGYAVGVHGSLERDLDLIAAPWIAEAVEPMALAEHIAAGLGGRVVDYERQDKPCGRWSCNIHTPDWTKMIDLSVMPPVAPNPAPSGEAAPVAADWVLVPSDPNATMIVEGAKHIGGGSVFDEGQRYDMTAEIYRAMIAASPPHPKAMLSDLHGAIISRVMPFTRDDMTDAQAARLGEDMMSLIRAAPPSLEITDEMVRRFEEVFYARHERGFLMRPLIDPPDTKAALTAALSPTGGTTDPAFLPDPSAVQRSRPSGNTPDLVARLRTDAAFLAKSDRKVLHTLSDDFSEAADRLESLSTVERDRDAAREVYPTLQNSSAVVVGRLAASQAEVARLTQALKLHERILLIITVRNAAEASAPLWLKAADDAIAALQQKEA